MIKCKQFFFSVVQNKTKIIFPIYFLFDFQHIIRSSRGLTTCALTFHLYIDKESYCVEYVELKMLKLLNFYVKPKPLTDSIIK